MFFNILESTISSSPDLSEAVKLISSKILSIIVCNLLAPIFSTVLLTSLAIDAIKSIPSSLKLSSTFSVFNKALYCLIKLLSGSFKILLKSSLFKASSSTLIGIFLEVQVINQKVLQAEMHLMQ